MTQIIPLKPIYSKSRVGVDWTCARKRYWAYEHDGVGITDGKESLELNLGSIVHDGLAAIAALAQKDEPVDIDLIASLAYKQMFDALWEPESGLPFDVKEFAKEQATLVEGMLRGFYLQAWPRLLSQYPNILLVEGEARYEHDGLIFFAKPDLVLANDEEICYCEYKTTSSKKDSWINSWNTNIQLHSTIRAIESQYGIKCDSVVVQGIYKGYESYGKQSSPFCYAYKRSGNPPFTKDEVAYEYKPGFRRYPTWELDGGVKAWLENMPPVILGDQFPQTPPIMIKDDLIDSFFAQRALREREIVVAVEDMGNWPEDDKKILDKVFPQKFDQCVPSFGRPCNFLRLCHGPNVDPLEAGFVHRTPILAEEQAKIVRSKDA